MKGWVGVRYMFFGVGFVVYVHTSGDSIHLLSCRLHVVPSFASTGKNASL